MEIREVTIQAVRDSVGIYHSSTIYLGTRDNVTGAARRVDVKSYAERIRCNQSTMLV